MPIFVLPPWMLALIILFVVLPSFMSMYYRFNLYRHLNDLADKVNRVISKSSPGIQPNIITILEKRLSNISMTTVLFKTKICVSVLCLPVHCGQQIKEKKL